MLTIEWTHISRGGGASQAASFLGAFIDRSRPFASISTLRMVGWRLVVPDEIPRAIVSEREGRLTRDWGG